MGRVAFLCAACALASLVLPGAGKLLAVGLGIFAIAAGVLAWRRPGTRARGRLLGAGAVTVGTVALMLGGLELALTLVAIERLAGLLG